MVTRAVAAKKSWWKQPAEEQRETEIRLACVLQGARSIRFGLEAADAAKSNPAQVAWPGGFRVQFPAVRLQRAFHVQGLKADLFERWLGTKSKLPSAGGVQGVPPFQSLTALTALMLRPQREDSQLSDTAVL